MPQTMHNRIPIEDGTRMVSKSKVDNMLANGWEETGFSQFDGVLMRKKVIQQEEQIEEPLPQPKLKTKQKVVK